MKKFLDENFLLKTKTAQTLYHDFAEHMPIIDYHCHLSPQQIWADTRFENLAKAWLNGDHYKWRAMRANGVPEEYCTGDKSDWEKFEKWAETLPFALRNPLYHWSHLELKRYFDVDELLSGATAKKIYEECSASLQTDGFSVRNLLRKMNVKLVCTTDDPVDSLGYHKDLNDQQSAKYFEINVLPAFRPDNAMDASDPGRFLRYVKKLEEASNTSIGSFEQYLAALRKRHDFFASMGCTVSDHGLEQIYSEDYTERELESIFRKILASKIPDDHEHDKFKSALLMNFAEWNAEKGWVQQFHLGAMRNNNSRMMLSAGKDTGHDSIGDFPQARSLARFLDKLDRTNRLAKTILYNLNPADNELMATMIGNFNDGSMTGKIQWGSAWWFLDQKDGIVRHLNTLSNVSLLSGFAGMITDSRSFLSFPRHEYFRRILCNLFGDDVEQGELPANVEWIGKIISDICYHNAVNYFNWQGRTGNFY